jgi:hypothetical protein
MKAKTNNISKYKRQIHTLYLCLHLHIVWNQGKWKERYMKDGKHGFQYPLDAMKV